MPLLSLKEDIMARPLLNLRKQNGNVMTHFPYSSIKFKEWQVFDKRVTF